MEHIVQFGIALDDSAIEKLVIEKASEEVKNHILKEITANMPKKWDYGVNWPEATAEVLGHWFEKNRDELMDMAAEKLASKAVRTKAWRERMGEVME